MLEVEGAKAIAEALKMFKSSTPGSTCVSPCVEPGAEPLNTFRAFGDGLGALSSDTAVYPTHPAITRSLSQNHAEAFDNSSVAQSSAH